MISERYAVYAPLSDFPWKGRCLELPLGLGVRLFEGKPELKDLDKSLAKTDKDILSRARHWLCFEASSDDTIQGAEIANLFLLALWLVKPTKAHIAFRFEVVTNAESQHVGTHYRMLDRFTWIPGYVQEEVYDSDLEAVAGLLPILREIMLARGRLLFALDLTSAGCMAFHWKLGLMSYTAATEALLTYREGGRLTQRLATTYACLIATDKSKRDQAFVEFSELYNIRSKVMHGRFDHLTDIDAFESLARLEKLLRDLWQKVLSSPELCVVLSSGDMERQPFFEEQQLGYQPPRLG